MCCWARLGAGLASIPRNTFSRRNKKERGGLWRVIWTTAGGWNFWRLFFLGKKIANQLLYCLPPSPFHLHKLTDSAHGWRECPLETGPNRLDSLFFFTGKAALFLFISLSLCRRIFSFARFGIEMHSGTEESNSRHRELLWTRDVWKPWNLFDNDIVFAWINQGMWINKFLKKIQIYW